MNSFNYCPKCGKTTIVWDGCKQWHCLSCDFTLYHNCAGAVAVILQYENEIFFTRRNQEPKKGLLDLSGGFVDPEETAEEACKRELYEELKLTIDIDNLQYLGSQPNVYRYKEFNYNTLDLFYWYPLREKFDADLELEEVSEGIWINKDQVLLEQIAFESQKTFLKKWLNY